MKIVAGRSNLSFAEDVAKNLNVSLANMNVKDFADNEIYVEVLENVRGEDMFVIQPTSAPAHANILELLIIIDALRRASANRITAVIPYFGYARQDRKTGPRTPISAKLVANLIVTAGANRVLTMDLHAEQIQGFFDVPTDNLFAANVFARDILTNKSESDIMIVSPDAGGAVRARYLAKRVEGSFAMVDKRREGPGVSEVMNIIGDPKGRKCILLDDIVDSAGTLCNAADALMAGGALSVSAYATHGVLSGNAAEKVRNSSLEELVITDTISVTKQAMSEKKIRILSVAPLMSEAIKRIANSESVSVLFD